MTAEKILEKLNELNKSFYTVADIVKISRQSPAVVKVALNRLVKRKKIVRLQKNVYVPAGKIPDYKLIAQQLDLTSYISFETALAQSNILSQLPYSLTLATARRSKKVKLGEQEIIYRKLKPNLIGDYSLVDGLRVASKEKALIDSLYLVSRGKMSLPVDELDMSSINKEKLKKLAKKYKLAKVIDGILP